MPVRRGALSQQGFGSGGNITITGGMGGRSSSIAQPDETAEERQIRIRISCIRALKGILKQYPSEEEFQELITEAKTSLVIDE